MLKQTGQGANFVQIVRPQQQRPLRPGNRLPATGQLHPADGPQLPGDPLVAGQSPQADPRFANDECLDAHRIFATIVWLPYARRRNIRSIDRRVKEVAIEAAKRASAHDENDH